MKAKEKAKELVDRYEHHFKSMKYGINFSEDIDHDIESALICVDEMIEALKINEWQNRLVINLYEEVKQEIIKL